jgi:hypothetical protein
MTPRDTTGFRDRVKTAGGKARIREWIRGEEKQGESVVKGLDLKTNSRQRKG